MKHLFKHIYKEVWHKHIFDYTLFLVASVLFVLGVWKFSGQRLTQFFMFVSFVAFYVVWGLYHHIITKTFRIKILVEYILIGLAIVFFAYTLALP